MAIYLTKPFGIVYRTFVRYTAVYVLRLVVGPPLSSGHETF